MINFCKYVECVSQIAKANNLVFFIVFCIYMTYIIYLFTDEGEGGAC